MKAVEEIIDHIEKSVELLTQYALNPDRELHLRERELWVRAAFVTLLDFIAGEAA